MSKVVKSVLIMLAMTMCLIFAVFQSSVCNKLESELVSSNARLISINQQKMSVNAQIALEKTPEFIISQAVLPASYFTSNVASNI